MQSFAKPSIRSHPTRPQGKTMDIVLVRAPSNLGLRPLREGHVPGAWRAPEALTAAGLVQAIRPSDIVDLPRPDYAPGRQLRTNLHNGSAMREFNLQLAGVVQAVVAGGRFGLVVGGDCSILLGALAGARQLGPCSLVHIDGHSDFRHPGNYDPESMLGSVAGMDLALATGRGEPLMTQWPGVVSPLVPDRQVVQLGERESRSDDFSWPDVNDTAITRIDVFAAQALDSTALLSAIWATLDQEPSWPFWIHLDVDVLDESVMPAVDSPGSPGIDPQKVIDIIGALAASGRCLGMTVTVFDPDLDSDGRLARSLVGMLRKALTSLSI
jgi:arginase